MQQQDRFGNTTINGIGKPVIKRKRSSNFWVPEGKRLKQYKSLTTAPELHVAIIDRYHPLCEIITLKWLLLEEKILH